MCGISFIVVFIVADEELEGGAGAGLSHTFPAACLYFLD